jgi:hypothetical protein
MVCRLMLDCMGHVSPVVRQLRHGQKPDGVCLTVGAICRGFQNNTTSDGKHQGSVRGYIRVSHLLQRHCPMI